MDRASYNMAIIIQQDTTEYFFLNLLTVQHVSGGIFIHHQELITLYLQYVALMRPPAQPRSRQATVQASFMPNTVDTVL